MIPDTTNFARCRTFKLCRDTLNLVSVILAVDSKCIVSKKKLRLAGLTLFGQFEPHCNIFGNHS